METLNISQTQQQLAELIREKCRQCPYWILSAYQNLMTYGAPMWRALPPIGDDSSRRQTGN